MKKAGDGVMVTRLRVGTRRPRRGTESGEHVGILLVQPRLRRESDSAGVKCSITCTMSVSLIFG